MSGGLRLRPVLSAALAIGLSGCGGPGNSSQQGPAAPHIRMQNDWSDQLAALPAPNRALSLRHAIVRNGYRCARVVRGAHQQEYSSMEMWVAQCDDGKSFALYIAPDGTVQVRECNDERQLGLPLCHPLGPSAELPDPAPAGNAVAPAPVTPRR